LPFFWVAITVSACWLQREVRFLANDTLIPTQTDAPRWSKIEQDLAEWLRTVFSAALSVEKKH
jgi:hypothetical protein